MHNEYISKISLPSYIEKLVPQSHSSNNWDWSSVLILMAICNWGGTQLNEKRNNNDK